MDIIIKAGYRLTVVSWENDADNYRTVVTPGLSRELITFYVKLCKLLQYSKDYRTGICNLYMPNEVQKARLKVALLTTRSLLSSDSYQSDEHFLDFAMESLYDLGLRGEDFLTRVCESFIVEYLPEDVTFKNVTQEFL